MSSYDIWMVFFILNHYFWKTKMLSEYNPERSKNLTLLPTISDTHRHTLIELFIKLVRVNGGFDFCNFYRYLNFGCCPLQDWPMDMNVHGVRLIMGLNKKNIKYLAFTSLSQVGKQQFFLLFLGFLFDVCEKNDF